MNRDRARGAAINELPSGPQLSEGNERDAARIVSARGGVAINELASGARKRLTVTRIVGCV